MRCHYGWSLKPTSQSERLFNSVQMYKRWLRWLQALNDKSPSTVLGSWHNTNVHVPYSVLQVVVQMSGRYHAVQASTSGVSLASEQQKCHFTQWSTVISQRFTLIINCTKNRYNYFKINGIPTDLQSRGTALLRQKILNKVTVLLDFPQVLLYG